MKRLTGFLTGLILLILIGNAGNLFAEEPVNSSIGLRYNYLKATESDQFAASNGIELYCIIEDPELKPLLGQLCVEIFIGFNIMKTDTAWLSKGELFSNAVGFSLLHIHRTKTATFYWGGGAASYTNDFKIATQTETDIATSIKQYYRDYYDETVTTLNYKEEMDNSFGVHLQAGVDIELFENLRLSGLIKKTFVKGDVTAQLKATTYDGSSYRNYSDKAEGELSLGALFVGIGLALQF